MIKQYAENYSYCLIIDNEENPTKMLRLKNVDSKTGQAFESSLEFENFCEEMSLKEFLFVPYKTEEELEQEKFDVFAEAVRDKRDSLLSKTDWTHTVDSQLSEERKLAWSIYRQALRDITAHESFPFLKDADWPIEP